MGKYKGGHNVNILQRNATTAVKNHNRGTAFERSLIIYWGVGGGGLNMFVRIRPLALRFCSSSKHLVRMKVF